MGMSLSNQGVDFLQLYEDLLSELGSLDGIFGKEGLEYGRLGACAPVVDNVARLSSLKCICGQESNEAKG